MKFYQNRPVLNHRGEQIKASFAAEDGGASMPLTLGALAVEALLRELPQDNNAPGKTKIARYNLAKDIQKNIGGKAAHSMILSTEDVALIKQRIASGFPAIVVGGAEDAIEGDGMIPEGSDADSEMRQIGI